MERRDSTKVTAKEKISALVDGEADPDGLREWVAQLAQSEGRQVWDVYHQIGDTLRSAEPGPAMSEDFGARFAERFASEPILLPPRRSLMARLGGWPTTMAAVAAAGFGFFIAPSLMRDAGPVAPASVATGMQAAAPALSMTAAVQASAADEDETLDYIALHQRAHASLYGAAPALHPAVLEATSPR